MVAVEVTRLLRHPDEPALADIDVEGREHLDRVMATAGRALAITAHLGNWELLSRVPRLTSYPISIVVRPLDARWLDPIVQRARRAGGVDVIEKRHAARPVLEALRRGHVVALLLDQNASRREGVFVPFFGRLANTSRSAAVLSLRTGAPLVPVFIRREPGGRHRITIRPPVSRPDAAAGEEAIVELTRRCTEAIELAIRETPEQWLWIHDRWRTRPPAEPRR